MRIRLAEAILGDMVIGLEIGKSPIKEDIYISPQKLTQVITTIRGSCHEACSQCKHRVVKA